MGQCNLLPQFKEVTSITSSLYKTYNTVYVLALIIMTFVCYLIFLAHTNLKVLTSSRITGVLNIGPVAI